MPNEETQDETWFRMVENRLDRLCKKTNCTQYQAAKALKALHNSADATELILLVKDIARQTVVECEQRD